MHSILALNSVKQRIGLSQKNYRLIYSLIASLLLMILLLYGATIYSVLIFAPSNVSTYFGLMLSATGIFVLKRSFRNYSLKEFLGIKAESKEAELVLTGMQAKIRHPLYLGTILLVLGYFIFNPQMSNLIILITTLIYLPFGIKLEEKKLIDQFGDAYTDYKSSTPAIIPKFW